MKNTILVVKDMFRRDFIRCEGGIVPTPALDRLVRNHTYFANHYSEAPGTNQFYRTLVTGLPTSELLERTARDPRRLERLNRLREIERRGFPVFLLWPECIFENLPGIPVTAKTTLSVLPDAADAFLRRIGEIRRRHPRYFIIAHLPQVFRRYSFADDSVPIDHLRSIAEFDGFAGAMLRGSRRESVVITSDHGAMLGEKGAFWYGPHVYEEAARVPLIANGPRRRISALTGSTGVLDLVLDGEFSPRRSIVVDSAFGCADVFRALAYVEDDLKLVYRPAANEEELFDLKYDPRENINLLSPGYLDRFRKGKFHAMRETINRRADWRRIDAFHRAARKVLRKTVRSSSGALAIRYPFADRRLEGISRALRDGDPARAVELFERLEGDYPLRFAAKGLYLDALIRLGRAREALAICDELLAMKPYNVPFRLKRASLLKKLGRAKAAFELYTQLIPSADLLAPDQKGSLFFHMGELHLARGRRRAAAESLRLCLAATPGHAAARKLLKGIANR